MAALLEGTFSQSVSPAASPRAAFTMADGPPAPFLGSAADPGFAADGPGRRTGSYQGDAAHGALDDHTVGIAAAGELAAKLAEVARLRADSDETDRSASDLQLTRVPSSSSPQIPGSLGVEQASVSVGGKGGGASSAARALKKVVTKRGGATGGGAHARSSSLPDTLAAASVTKPLVSFPLDHASSYFSCVQRHGSEDVSSLGPLQV
jgi:hypothetical protein